MTIMMELMISQNYSSLLLCNHTIFLLVILEPILKLWKIDVDYPIHLEVWENGKSESKSPEEQMPICLQSNMENQDPNKIMMTTRNEKFSAEVGMKSRKVMITNTKTNLRVSLHLLTPPTSITLKTTIKTGFMKLF